MPWEADSISPDLNMNMKDYAMKAMLLKTIQELTPDSRCLDLCEVPRPQTLAGQVRIKVRCCGVCHTELDEIEGRAAPSVLPRILGHQVVGVVDQCGAGVQHLKQGDRVGVAWIFSSCGTCEFCLRGDDNLCPQFQATGRDADGGYAEYMTVPADCAFPLPDEISDLEAAPLLCAGAIGYRSLRLAQLSAGQRIGFTGFGASAHLMLKMIRYLYPQSDVYVFARDPAERAYALALGAVWAGTTTDAPPQLLHAVIDTTPAWLPVLKALEVLLPGGRLVINAIRKNSSDQALLAQLNYEHHLWQEKEIKSVANVSRRDVREFLDLAARMQIRPDVQVYALEQANQALIDLKFSSIRGAKVLQVG